MTTSTLILTDSERVRVDAGGRSIGLFCRRLPARVDEKLLGELKDFAARHPAKNVRLCLHEGPEAPFHDMIILERRGAFHPPHRHHLKGETWHIIEGVLGCFSFDQDGRVGDSLRLGADGNLIYRVALEDYHTAIPLTDLVIYHESKPGPFLGAEDSLVPPWAPDSADPEAVARYLDWLAGHFQ
jgi:cupin fold WbuC family metalloprotein